MHGKVIDDSGEFNGRNPAILVVVHIFEMPGIDSAFYLHRLGEAQLLVACPALVSACWFRPDCCGSYGWYGGCRLTIAYVFHSDHFGVTGPQSVGGFVCNVVDRQINTMATA